LGKFNWTLKKWERMVGKWEILSGRRVKGSQHSILVRKKGNSTLIKKHSQHILHELSIGIVGFQSKEWVMGYVCFSMGKGAFWWANGLFPL
jgi:hypothetical protein